jgi:hypothetical protein
LPTNENLPQGKKKKEKKTYYFSIKKRKKKREKSFFKNGIEEIAHFSKISKRNFSKLPKTKKEFTDSALIIQERDFSHL